MIARAVQSRSFLVNEDTSIFTKTIFHVESIIKNDDDDVPDTIAFTDMGGELVDQGDTLRVRVADGRPFASKHAYLLFLARQEKLEKASFAGIPAAMAIRNGKLFSWGQSLTRMPPGTALDSLLSSLQQFATPRGAMGTCVKDLPGVD